MCDYSLKAARTRDAKKGDVLTPNNFGTMTVGLCHIADIGKGSAATAVCLRPGTEVAFGQPVERRKYRRMEWLVRMLTGTRIDKNQRTAIFVQIDTHDEETHHDALQFSNGQSILINELEPGQHLNVLQLPAVPKTRAERKSQRRLPVVA